MNLNQNIDDVLEEYFIQKETQHIIDEVNDIRVQAIAKRQDFFKKYKRHLIIVYIFIIVGMFIFHHFNFNGYGSKRVDSYLLIVPIGLYLRRGYAVQESHLSQNKTQSKLFNHFISSMIPGAKFDETSSLFGESADKSKLFTNIYKYKTEVNSFFIPLFYDISGKPTVTLTGMEVELGKEKIGNKSKNTSYYDYGILYRIEFQKPRRIIHQEIVIKKDIIKWGIGQKNKVELEDKEFEEYFDVYGEDQLEVRTILTSNVMLKLANLIQKKEEIYSFRFINNTFYIKRKLESGFIDIDWNLSIDSNKICYREFYTELLAIQQVVDALRVDYFNIAV